MCSGTPEAEKSRASRHGAGEVAGRIRGSGGPKWRGKNDALKVGFPRMKESSRIYKDKKQARCAPPNQPVPSLKNSEETKNDAVLLMLAQIVLTPCPAAV